MTFTPVQAMQLVHGIESSPFRRLTEDEKNTAAVAAKLTDWTTITGVIDRLLDPAKNPLDPLMTFFLARRPMLNHPAAEVAASANNKLQWESKTYWGIHVIYVEGFEPTVGQSFAGEEPYWDPKSNTVPELIVRRSDEAAGSILRYQRLKPGFGTNSMADYGSPINVPGLMEGELDGVEEWTEIKTYVKPPEESEEPHESNEIDLYQGDVLFAVDATFSLEVENAHVANLLIAGFARRRKDDCGARPC